MASAQVPVFPNVAFNRVTFPQAIFLARKFGKRFPPPTEYFMWAKGATSGDLALIRPLILYCGFIRIRGPTALKETVTNIVLDTSGKKEITTAVPEQFQGRDNVLLLYTPDVSKPGFPIGFSNPDGKSIDTIEQYGAAKIITMTFSNDSGTWKAYDLKGAGPNFKLTINGLDLTAVVQEERATFGLAATANSTGNRVSVVFDYMSLNPYNCAFV